MAIDVHRHLCTPRLFEALAGRSEAPRLRREGHVWRLQVAHEPESMMPPLPEAASSAQAELRASGLDSGIIALSAALGVENLPGGPARRILDAWHADCAELPSALRAWGSLPLTEASPADVDAALADGRVGVSVPACSLVTPADLDELGPVLEQLERRNGILFIHPGPARRGQWMPALTAYPASLLSAWVAWAAHGRPRHPRLRVLFAALAGLGPVHAERVASRGGPALASAALADELTYYDTSSYGRLAVQAMARVVGEDRLVYGSDRPWAGRPGEHKLLPDALSNANAERLLVAA
jgi:6-methylsalicylate decarboxylase